MMNEQEQADLEALKAEIQKVKLSTFDFLRSLDRASEHDLLIMGHRGRTNAEAMRKAYQDALKRIEKLTQEHVRKYPD